MQSQYDSNGDRFYVVAQITLLLAAICILLFSSIIFGIGSSLGEINTSIPIIAVIIVLLSAGMTKFPAVRNKYTYLLLMSLIVAFLLFLSFVTLSQNLEVKAITSFTMSAIFYMILGLLAAIAISFAYFGKTMFITWEKTRLWRDLFFMACGVWFVFGVTAYLSVVNATPFNATAFLGVPFSASNVAWTDDFTQSGIAGIAGFIEGNFFFTFVLGFISVLRITQVFPKEQDWQGRLVVVIITSVIFGLLIAYLHTGLHDQSQRSVLGYIAIFFIIGAAVTLFFETSFAFILAQGFIDFMKSCFNSGNPVMDEIAWFTFICVTIIGLFSLMMWRTEGKFRIKF